jgi:hypothetical protein
MARRRINLWSTLTPMSGNDGTCGQTTSVSARPVRAKIGLYQSNDLECVSVRPDREGRCCLGDAGCRRLLAPLYLLHLCPTSRPYGPEMDSVSSSLSTRPGVYRKGALPIETAPSMLFLPSWRCGIIEIRHFNLRRSKPTGRALVAPNFMWSAQGISRFTTGPISFLFITRCFLERSASHWDSR